MEYLWVGVDLERQGRGRVSIGSCHMTADCDLCQTSGNSVARRMGQTKESMSFDVTHWNLMTWFYYRFEELLSSLANEVKLSCKSFKAIVPAQLALPEQIGPLWFEELEILCCLYFDSSSSQSRFRLFTHHQGLGQASAFGTLSGLMKQQAWPQRGQDSFVKAMNATCSPENPPATLLRGSHRETDAFI